MTDEQREVNIEIGRRLGWTVEEYYSHTTPKRKTRVMKWKLNAPIGYWGAVHCVSEEAALSKLPRWATSLDIAVRDLVAEDEWFSLKRVAYDVGRGPHWTAVMARNDYDEPEGIGMADTPALAVCKAWLAWEESQE